MSRPTSPDGITIARLHGTARRHSMLGTDTVAAVDELRAITDRPDLLGEAAGTCWAAVQLTPEISPWDARALELLVEAGADRDVAAAVVERIRARQE